VPYLVVGISDLEIQSNSSRKSLKVK